MGRSGKLRSGTAGKLKRWRKGHSSDSNPEGRRYRQAARGRLLAPRSENSNLTVDALKLHNDLQSSGPVPRENAKSLVEDNNESAKSYKSSATFLSGLTDCTNLTFSRVQRLWESNSAAHKEICAVLAAVTEVIRTQGGTESETEYFGVLMTTLEAVESPESLAAVAYLLSLVLKRVPSPVLIKKFSDTSKAFMGILSSQACGDSNLALRWILSCAAILLRRQNLAAWNYPVTMQVFHGLLSFTVHVKPKVRKAAQQGVSSILRGSEFLFGDGAPLHHPAAISTAKFCVQEIEKSGGAKEATTTLHMLTLLRDLLPCFPAPAVKSCCETLLRVMTLSHVLVTACAMKAFHSLFAAQSSPMCLPAELNAQIIMALYDYAPNENDLQPLLAWLAVMERAHVNIAKLQWDLCCVHLPRLFSVAMNCFLSHHSQVVEAAAKTLMVLLKECVAPHVTELGHVSSATPSGSAAHICKMFRIVEEGLTYQYHAAWASVLQVLKVFFEACGQQCHPIMQKCLQSLADLRSSSHFPHIVLLDQTLGAAVATMGPQVVLEAIPLDIDGTEETLDFPRSWLLPVLRDHIQSAPLAFFSSHFLPLAASLKNRASDLAQEGRELEAKIYNTLQWQIWTLLPSFCNHATDVVLSFKGLARTLGTAINDSSELRQIVCQALRKLINKGCPTEAERAEAGRFAKNFLPIMFNVYSQEGDESESSAHRRSLLDTIRSYLTVTEAGLVNSFLEKACEKLTSSDSSEFTRLSILDLVVAMAPYADEPSLYALYGSIHSSLQNKDHRIQKKIYRVLEEVCASDQPACHNFVQSHLEELKSALLDSLSSATSPAKRPRLKCLFHIIKQLTVEHEDFVTALVPEVILCTKEVSVGARKNAYNLLVEIGRAFIRFGPTPNEGMQRYLLLIYAGLTGSITMISCTVLALARLLYEFKEHIGSDALEELVKHVCLMVGSRTRDVVKSALGFLKVTVLLLDTTLLGRHLETMLEAIGGLTDDMRRHFRVKLRNLLSKLIRKFGFEPLQALLPESYRKVLLNIRKAEARNRKRQAVKRAVATSAEEGTLAPPKGDSIEDILADSDSDLEDKTDKRKGRVTRKVLRQQNQAWLKEGESDEPLNFLDPNVAHRVLATRPGTAQTGKVKHDFNLSADGRLIICEEEEEPTGLNEESEDLMQEVGIKNKKSRKRRFREEADDEGLPADTKPQYKAGGIGIHRPVSKKAGPGAEYKAKKGKGDIKKKGGLDPYAYIPLNRAKLNRRKKAKLQGQYTNLMKGAQRGAQAGKRLFKKQTHS
ncbi:RRP12-like protein [Erythrolamprus reginae]|uniref:RRP12-like protein n=1 Tax=Erythrolamprus reginae TaxID=121349 RepID=UPI00396C645F